MPDGQQQRLPLLLEHHLVSKDIHIGLPNIELGILLRDPHIGMLSRMNEISSHLE